jgi:hypothetical protein
VDENNVDVRGAAQQGVVIGDQGTGEIRGDEAAIVEGAFLGCLFGDPDQ